MFLFFGFRLCGKHGILCNDASHELRGSPGFVIRDEGEKTRAKEDIEYEPVASPSVYGVDCC